MRLSFFLFAYMLMMTAAYAQPDALVSSKVSAALLQNILRSGNSECIILMQDKPFIESLNGNHDKITRGSLAYTTLTAHAEVSQKNLLEELNNRRIPYTSFWVVNAVLVKADAALVQQLASRADVKQVVSNSHLKAAVPLASPTVNNRDAVVTWGIDSIHAPAVWEMGFEGQDVVIGGEDTGFDWQHPAIKNQYRGWDGSTADHNYNWHDAIHAIDWHNYGDNPCGIDILEPCDDYGHGTHTMGTMVGEDGELKIGVAPKAKWIGQRNMERGWGNLAGYLESFQWFIAPTDLNNENPDPSKAPHVINNSWYCSEDEGCDPSSFALMEEAVNNLKAAGIVVVVSAGNSGPDCNTIVSPPALFESSFTIGAVDFLLNAASFSSRGSTPESNNNLMKPNVSAPGVDVLSCIPGGQYASFSGTSMAGPHAAGVVALMISANPSLAGEVELIESILEQTARIAYTTDGCSGDQPLSLPNNTFGYGIIDALAAVEKALLTTTVSNATVVSQVHVVNELLSDELEISISGQCEKGIFQLYNTSGQMLTQHNLQQGKNHFSLFQYPAGLYFYKVSYISETISGKLILK